MGLALELAERNLLPRPVVRLGIRRLLQRRLDDEARRHRAPDVALAAWLAEMARAEIAPVPAVANAQHYEVPPAFFEQVLGRNLKYSSAWYGPGVTSLDAAEDAMLALTVERAALTDGQEILELGCGWGSLTLHMARRFPSARITAVSNSAPQRRFIEARAAAEHLTNVTILTADMNTFEAPDRYDRVVSVEMFEHMRNWGALLRRVRGWLRDEGRVFLHVFAHRTYAYPFVDAGDDDWMARHFFSGGMMPSVDLIDHLDAPFMVEAKHLVDGTHYARTSEAWLANLDAREREVLAIFRATLDDAAARRQVQRWRLFFLACAELFGYRGGAEWLVLHVRLAPTPMEGR